ncbi:hypothetical protein BGX21_007562 [Mortierella sp. AD011]|nr:hypothetical protein BGX20_005103 [Mortierella sp. AD010]KAF9398596.1 hypothetical protein BGX21_007562 [Mortierella sp. AD011]
MKEIKASITIQAPLHEVWTVLTDLDHYHDWNPLFVQAKGTIADGETLSIKARLPSMVFCGAPLLYSRSPKITKAEQNSFLEWFTTATGVKATHYFKLTSQDGKTTEFIQGECYGGWGAGFGSTEGARRGIVAMNNALQLEVTRRREGSSGGNSGSETKNPEKDENVDNVAQLDISDKAAVAAAAAAAAFSTIDLNEADDTLQTDENEKGKEALSNNGVISPPVEKYVEKRTSIIGAVSSLFSSSKPTSSDRIQGSSSKDDLISKTVLEESGESNMTATDEGDGDEDEDEDEEMEDPASKQEREAKNAERIELDFGPSDMSFGDFGL